MTGKEILQADIIDIVFEYRNKDYGAYTLRRNYNNRLSIALSIALGVVFLLILISANRKKNGIGNFTKPDRVTVLDISDAKLKTSPPKQKVRPAKPLAQIKSTSRIEIVKDEKILRTDVPVVTDLVNKIISDQNVAGQFPDDSSLVNNVHLNKEVGKTQDVQETKNDFRKDERNAAFPGGQTGLSQFFSRHLNIPDDLEPGTKKTVLVRFLVDVDGSVSKIEVLQSGGDKYDKEIMRVFRKMPVWLPAIQNGHKVPVNLIQPVIFVGVED